MKTLVELRKTPRFIIGQMTDSELIKEITKILALHKLGWYTMAEAFMMIVDLVEDGYR